MKKLFVLSPFFVGLVGCASINGTAKVNGPNIQCPFEQSIESEVTVSPCEQAISRATQHNTQNSHDIVVPNQLINKDINLSNHSHSVHNHYLPSEGWLPPPNSYRPQYTHKLLSDYAEQMAMKLVENMRYVSDRTPVAVASFVDLDSQLNRTNILGNQLAESFMTEFQEFGVPVVDYKTTGKISVTQNGDFVFSRQNINDKVPYNIEYILSGTLAYNDRGVIVNARVIGVDTRVVVSSAKGFIPHFVVNSLHPRGYKDGIRITPAD